MAQRNCDYCGRKFDTDTPGDWRSGATIYGTGDWADFDYCSRKCDELDRGNEED